MTDRNMGQIERHLPPYLSQAGVMPSAAPKYLYVCRVRAAFLFVKTLIARQSLVEELDSGVEPTGEETTEATLEACRLSVDTVKTYSRLRHHGILHACGFHAVSHVTAAAHTLIACMLRSSDLAIEHRPNLLTAIDILLVFSSIYPRAETVGQLLVQLSRNLDHNNGSNTQSETVAIRVLARRMARSPSQPSFSTPALTRASGKQPSFEDAAGDPLSTEVVTTEADNVASGPGSYSSTADISSGQTDGPLNLSGTEYSGLSWSPLMPLEPFEYQWTSNSTDHMMWEDSFSFLNDGLFSKL